MSRTMKAIRKAVMCKDGKKRTLNFKALPVTAVNDGPTDKRWAPDTRAGLVDIKIFSDYAYYNAFYDAIKAGVDPRSTKAKRIEKTHRTDNDVQRDAVSESCDQIQERVSGKVLVGGEVVKDGQPRVPFFQAWCILINVADDRLIYKDKNGNMWVLIPVDEHDFDEFLGSIGFIDGQHRVISFAEAFSLIEGIIDVYSVHMFVLLNATKQEKLMHFHSINGECKVVSTEQNYASCIAMGQKKEEEREMYEVVRMNAGNAVKSEDDMTVVPQMSGNINLGHKEGRISCKNICQFTCLDRNDELRQDNLPSVMSKCGIATASARAGKLNDYTVAWNGAHEHNYGFKMRYSSLSGTPNHNLFNEIGGMLSRQSYSNFVWAIAPAVFECANSMPGGVTVHNMKKVICALMHDILEVDRLWNVDEIGSGRKTMMRKAEDVSDALKKKYGI